MFLFLAPTAFTCLSYIPHNPSSVPCVTWEAVTGVEGFYDTRWLTRLWSTQDKVENIVLKAAWQWGSNSSV